MNPFLLLLLLLLLSLRSGASSGAFGDVIL